MLGHLRHWQTPTTVPERSSRRPVLLATLGVGIDPSAERMAIETALETGAPLVIANLVRLVPVLGTTRVHRGGAALPPEGGHDAVRGTADRAAAQGVDTELLRVLTSRPGHALAELVREREVVLLVVGPDATKVRRRAVRKAVHAVRDADCLVWIAPDGYWA